LPDVESTYYDVADTAAHDSKRSCCGHRELTASRHWVELAVRLFWSVCGVGCDLTRTDDDVAGESAIEIGLDAEVEVIL
jgi:hypothetical protein